MKEKDKTNFGLIMAVYLLGIFMGALDTGIVTPARTVIQESLGVSEQAGIWMITIYTLAYAASIPVMGKLADRMGRRTIYLVSIFLFGTGSLLCGISHNMDSFTMLLISRAVQAIGGGGIVPVATAEFGTTFPEEKRGMALGMVGGVYGIANIFGASAGSLVMDIFGTDRWEFIFYVNVPIAVFILIAGFKCLPNTREKNLLPIDGAGICVLVVMILSLMYGLKNIDFFDFAQTISDPSVYWFLIGFLVLLPVFILVEKRAKDPVMNLKYFTNLRIIMTLLITIITGIILMGMVFIPQFCENALKCPTGEGGYFVIILGVCAGVGAMSSGHMTDRKGPKFVLGIGFVTAIIGSLIIVFFASDDPNRINVFASLIFIGLGIGFTMGAPLNYMMLGEVEEKEANSALATLSLVRSLGTVIAPAIMVGFIAHAGAGMSDEIMDIMPKEISMPSLPYAQELEEAMEEQDIDGMPDLSSMESMEIDMGGESDFEMPDEIIDDLQSRDVTSITEGVVNMTEYMFGEMMPEIQADIYDGIDKGIDGIKSGIAEMDDNIKEMKEASDGMKEGIEGMSEALKTQKAKKAEMEASYSEMKKGLNGINEAIDGIEEGIKAIENNIYMDPAVKAAQLSAMTSQLKSLEKKKKEMKSAMDGISKGIAGIETGIANVKAEKAELEKSKAEMEEAIEGISEGKSEAGETLKKMKALKAAVPDALSEAEENYIATIYDMKPEIEKTFQKTLNIGFRQIFEMTAIGAGIGILLLLLYRRKKENEC